MHTHLLHRMLRRRYVVAVLIIATLAILKFAVITSFLTDTSLDSEIINTAGRQRVLSYEVVNKALIYAANPSEVEMRDELKMQFAQFIYAHQELSKPNGKYFEYIDFPIRSLYSRQSEAYERIVSVVACLLQDDFDCSGAQELVRYQKQYSQFMNRILDEYEQRAKEKHDTLLDVVVIIFIATILTLLLEVIFIFRPAIHTVMQYIGLVNRNAELERSNRDLEQFAYVASHDLRAPLRHIGSFVSLLERSMGERINSQQRDLMLRIQGSCERMKGLVGDLLIYSRVGSHTLKREPIVLERILRHILDDLSVVLDEAGAKIALPDSSIVINADITLMERILENLIVNAVKFRRPGVPPRISVSCEVQDSLWKFSVQDNGIGIDREYFDRIFNIFQRLHTHDAYEGSGIGLSVCQKAVAMHGGKIWVESELNVGTTFFFTISKYARMEQRE